MKKIISFFSLTLLLCNINFLWAQEPEDIAVKPDEFQDSFYESLKQKGIENYDKAIEALEKCQQSQPENPIVFFELGKNYLFHVFIHTVYSVSFF